MKKYQKRNYVYIDNFGPSITYKGIRIRYKTVDAAYMGLYELAKEYGDDKTMQICSKFFTKSTKFTLMGKNT